MSGTRTAPAGVDTFDASDLKMMDEMRAGDGGIEIEQEAPATPPAPAATSAPEADEGLDLAPDDGAGKKPSDTVPHAQFHAMNERRKAAEKKAQEAETARQAAETKAAAERARVEERLSLLTQAVQQSAQPAPVVEQPLPDPETDPIGHFRAKSERLEKAIEELRGGQRTMTEAQQRQAQVTEMQNWARASEDSFARTEPTYVQAVNHLWASRTKDLELVGITDPGAQRTILANEAMQLAQMARQNGVNFAQTVYGLATQRGFQKPADSADTPAVPPIPTAAEAAAVVPDARAATIQRGQEQSTTISGAGAAPPTRLTPERIANMSEAEFGKVYEQVKSDPAKLRQLMGE